MRLSRADRIGIVVFSLMMTIGLAVVGYFVWGKAPTACEVSAEEERQMALFDAQVRHEDSIQRHKHASGNADDPLPTSELFPFDPNTADYATFLRLGLRPWQAKNALKYRSKGGRWRSPDDFQRLYGLSQADFLRLRPYIVMTESPVSHKSSALNDTLRYPRTPKLSEGQTVPLNASDTTALKLIPGVGSYTAAKIVRYRERLGGFVSKAQLNDLPDLPPDIHRYLHFDATDIHRIPINRATFKELIRHPYLNYEQVKAIVTHIRNYGSLRSWHDLQYNALFSEKDLQRLAPYFEF